MELLIVCKKVCKKCKKEKSFSDYGIRRDSGNFYSDCKLCRSKQGWDWNKANWGRFLESAKIRRHRWKKNNPELYYKAHRSGAKRYREEHPEKCKELMRQWHQRNKDAKVKKYREEYRKNPKAKINHTMSGAILQALKNNKSGHHWEDLVDYTVKDLKKHLESKFEPGMTWDNHGQWHVDHIRPISSFNYTNPNDKEFKECWALDNLQPLWARDNLRKSDKI